jgi:hypothetical protein
MVGAYHADEHIFECLGAGSQLGHGAGRHQLAVMDDGHAIAKSLYHFEHVRGQEHGCARPHLIEQNFLHEPRAHRIDALDWLVQQKQLRAMDQHQPIFLQWQRESAGQWWKRNSTPTPPVDRLDRSNT